MKPENKLYLCGLLEKKYVKIITGFEPSSISFVVSGEWEIGGRVESYRIESCWVWNGLKKVRRLTKYKIEE